jgi:thymidylate synthase (methanogen type)
MITNFNTPQDAWHYILNQITEHGNQIITEDNQLIKELLNIKLSIEHPLVGYPIKGAGWDLPALEKYAHNLCNFSYNLAGFDYQYSERMGRQIYYIIEMLKKYPTSRRATAYLWLPEKDLETKLHKPCQIVANYVVRDNRLHATHFFRSHDMKQAWPTNVYGLGKLQEMISNEIGCQTGSLTTFSVSAHYYVE